MANVPREYEETRKHPRTPANGTRMSVWHNGHWCFFSFNSTDGGGWIYPNWEKHEPGLPGWLRATQCVLASDISTGA